MRNILPLICLWLASLDNIQAAPEISANGTHAQDLSISVSDDEIKTESGVMVAQATIFEVKGVTFPEEVRVNIQVTVSYDPLRKGIDCLREIASVLDHLAVNDTNPLNNTWTPEIGELFTQLQGVHLHPNTSAKDRKGLIPVTGAIAQKEIEEKKRRFHAQIRDPKYWFTKGKGKDGNSMVNKLSIPLVECRISCKAEDGRVAAPTSDNDLRQMRRLVTKPNRWIAHIDREYSLSEARYVNPVNGKPIASLYKKSVWKVGPWAGPEHKPLPTKHNNPKSLEDDVFSGLFIVSNPDYLWSRTLEAMGYYQNSDARYWVITDNRLEANCICERVDKKADPALYTDINSMPVSEINKDILLDLSALMYATADREEEQLNNAVGTFAIDAPELFGSKQISLVYTPTSNGNRTARSPQLELINNIPIWLQNPLIQGVGKMVGSILTGANPATIERMRESRYFRTDVKKQLNELYKKAAEQSQDLGTLTLNQEQLEHSMREMTHDIAFATSAAIQAGSAFEALTLKTTGTATVNSWDRSFNRGLQVFTGQLETIEGHKTPASLYRGPVLDNLRRTLAEKHGLSMRLFLQNSHSTIIPSDKPNAIVVLSSLKATGKPWILLRELAVPQWVNGQLWQAVLPSEYVAVNREFTKYVPLTEDRMSNCKDQACNIPGPYRYLTNYKCGPGLITGGGLESCPIKKLPADDYFAASDFGLTFAVRSPVRASIVCQYTSKNLSPQRVILKGSGLLQIAPGCQLTTPGGEEFHGPVYSNLQATATYKIHDFAAQLTSLSKIIQERQNTLEQLDSNVTLAPSKPDGHYLMAIEPEEAHWSASVRSILPYAFIALIALILIMLLLCCCSFARMRFYVLKVKDRVQWLLSNTTPNPRPSPTPPKCTSILKTIAHFVVWFAGCKPRRANYADLPTEPPCEEMLAPILRNRNRSTSMDDLSTRSRRTPTPPPIEQDRDISEATASSAPGITTIMFDTPSRRSSRSTTPQPSTSGTLSGTFARTAPPTPPPMPSQLPWVPPPTSARSRPPSPGTGLATSRRGVSPANRHSRTPSVTWVDELKEKQTQMGVIPKTET